MLFTKPLVLAALLAFAQTSIAVEMTEHADVDKTDPDVVFAYQGDAVLTQTGLDAAFSKINGEHRLAFIRDGARVDQLHDGAQPRPPRRV